MARLLSHACHCDACQRRDSREFGAIVAASFAPRELARFERAVDAATIDNLERAYLAPAVEPAAAVCAEEDR